MANCSQKVLAMHQYMQFLKSQAVVNSAMPTVNRNGHYSPRGNKMRTSFNNLRRGHLDQSNQYSDTKATIRMSIRELQDEGSNLARAIKNHAVGSSGRNDLHT